MKRAASWRPCRGARPLDAPLENDVWLAEGVTEVKHFVGLVRLFSRTRNGTGTLGLALPSNTWQRMCDVAAPAPSTVSRQPQCFLEITEFEE